MSGSVELRTGRAITPSAAEEGVVPVIEIFGPTIQGEGPESGRPAYFVRFGGCDYRCSWCDTMYAVDPVQVRETAEYLRPDQIAKRLRRLPAGPALVVLSGGNPALFDLGDLVDALHQDGLEVAVETQGSVWRPWLAKVDRLVVSPKPPSSGMVSLSQTRRLAAFCRELAACPARWDVKVAIFDELDLDWAENLQSTLIDTPLFLIAGSDVGLGEDETMSRLRLRYRWLCEATARRVGLANARVLMQLQVLAWGTIRGV
jgi:7-carboxy-7-deazaguanine synthase